LGLDWFGRDRFGRESFYGGKADDRTFDAMPIREGTLLGRAIDGGAAVVF
jgi:hypothetical protein